MLLETAIGDAYGIGFEFVKPELLPPNDLAGYYRHPHYPIAPGHYSDDTQMSIAVAEALLADEPFTKQLFARHFVETFRRDRRDAYARHFQEFLESVESADEFLDRIQPASDRSGAAMRAGPIGLLPTPELVVRGAEIQASVTHDTPDGRAAATAAALMVHYCHHELGPKSELGRWLEARVDGHRWSEPWSGKVRLKGWMSVRAAVTAIVRHDSLSEILQACVAYTGDTDTVAAIAMAAASTSPEINRDLPDILVEGLEDGPYGRRYLEGLDRRLLQISARPSGQ